VPGAPTMKVTKQDSKTRKNSSHRSRNGKGNVVYNSQILFTAANKSSLLNIDAEFPLILFGNIVFVTFLKIFLDVHNRW
jgi:hypothetical protein